MWALLVAVVAAPAGAGLSCWREPSFGAMPATDRAPLPAAQGGGLALLPGGGSWALNQSTAVFFVGNSTRMETAAEYASDARWAVLGYSWNVDNIGSRDGRLISAEEIEVEEARAVHNVNRRTRVFVTREVQVVGTWYKSINLNNQSLIKDGWFIMCPGSHGTDLQPCLSSWDNNGFSPPRVTPGRWLNWSNPAAADWWVNQFIGGALATREIGGIFLDGGPGVPTNAHGISTDAAACGQMARDAQSAFNRAHALSVGLGKFLTTQGAVGGALTAAPWESTGLQPKLCTAGGSLGGCLGKVPITVNGCKDASRAVLKIAETLAASGHTFQFWSQGGAWWDFPGPPPKGRGNVSDVKVNKVAFDAQIALFQIARGESALLQWHDWSFTETKDYIWSDALDLDYGVPLEQGREVSPGVFSRKWSKRIVTLNCSAFVEQLHTQSEQ